MEPRKDWGLKTRLVDPGQPMHTCTYVCMHTYDYIIPTYSVYVYNICVYTDFTYICIYAVYDLHITCVCSESSIT